MSGSPLLSWRHQSNNVASFWLLRGNAGAQIVRNCDTAATAAFCSIGATIFRPESKWFAAVLASTLPVVGFKAR
jgi:hypothetical protein